MKNIKFFAVALVVSALFTTGCSKSGAHPDVINEASELDYMWNQLPLSPFACGHYASAALLRMIDPRNSWTPNNVRGRAASTNQCLVDVFTNKNGTPLTVVRNQLNARHTVATRVCRIWNGGRLVRLPQRGDIVRITGPVTALRRPHFVTIAGFATPTADQRGIRALYYDSWGGKMKSGLLPNAIGHNTILTAVGSGSCIGL